MLENLGNDVHAGGLASLAFVEIFGQVFKPNGPKFGVIGELVAVGPDSGELSDPPLGRVPGTFV